MASDVLCLTLYNLEEENAPIPQASDIAACKTGKDEFSTLIACDTLEYRQYYDSKAVKKTLNPRLAEYNVRAGRHQFFSGSAKRVESRIKTQLTSRFQIPFC